MPATVASRWSSAAEILADPAGAAAEILASPRLYGIVRAHVVVTNDEVVVFWLTMKPPVPAANDGYPIEQVSITVWCHGRIVAAPRHPEGRTWIHRLRTLHGELCLFLPWDPRGLRWEWDNDLMDFVMIVYRHLMSEEYARRNDGRWPAEDAPHGRGKHPILTDVMRRAARTAA